MLAEPDVALTDYAVAIEAAVLAWLIRRDGEPGRLRGWFVTFFVSVTLAAALGGTVHGFFPGTATGWGAALWKATLLALGVTALAAWGLGARLRYRPATARRVEMAAGAVLAVHVLLVLALPDPSFTLVVVNHAAAILFLAAALVARYHARHESHAGRLLAALGVMLAGSLLQQAGVGIHPRFFTPNALYHVIQAAALLLLFAGARRFVALAPDPRRSR
jgi:hypothetical protein